VSIPDYASYHQIELIWTETAAELYIDGVLEASIISNIPTIALPYKIINTCWAGDSPGQRFYTDYVNVTRFYEGTTITSIHEPSEPSNTEIVTVRANVSDSDGVSQVILSYSVNGGSSWTNSTMTDHLNGTYTQTIPAQTASTIVSYKFYSEDGKGYWAGTSESSYTVVISLLGPTITTAHTPLSPDQDTVVTISANVTDSDGVSIVILSYSTNGGSSWTNSSMIDLLNGTYTQTILPQSSGTTVLYIVYANDTLDVWTVSSQDSYIVIDSTEPTIDHPSDIVYEEGATGNSITWNPSDEFPESYQIFRNGVQIRTGLWNSSAESITISVDGLAIGLYNFALVVYDVDENSASDTVLVNVADLTPPLLDNPEDIIYEEGSIGYNITWNPTDAHPTSYVVLRNGSEIESGHWAGDSIIVFIDGLPSGNYNYTLVVIDVGSNRASDEVTVTVLAVTTTTTTETTTTTTTSEPPVNFIQYLFDNPVVFAALISAFGVILAAYIQRKKSAKKKHMDNF